MPKTKQTIRLRKVPTPPPPAPSATSPLKWWEDLKGRRNGEINYTIGDVCEIFNKRDQSELPTNNLRAYFALMGAEGKDLRARARRIAAFYDQFYNTAGNSTASNENPSHFELVESSGEEEEICGKAPMRKRIKQEAASPPQPLPKTTSIAVNTDKMWAFLDSAPASPETPILAPTPDIFNSVEAGALNAIQQIVFEGDDEITFEQKRMRAETYCYMAFNVPGITSLVAENADKVVRYWQHNGETEIPNNQLALDMPEFDQVFAKQDHMMRALVRSILRQKYCAWRAEATAHEAFYRHWAQMIFQLETADKISQGDNIFDLLQCAVCAAGGNGVVPDHDAEAGCWFIIDVGYRFEALVDRTKNAMRKRFPVEFVQCNINDARNILAVEWMRLGEGHGLVTRRGQ